MPRRSAALLPVVLAAVVAGCVAPAAVQPAGLPAALVPAPLCADPCARVLDGEDWRSWESSVAVDPLDPQHVVVGEYIYQEDAIGNLRGWVLAHVSRDAGATWETARLPGGPSMPPGHPLAMATWLGDPVVAFLPDGTLLFSFLALLDANTPLDLAGAGALQGYDLFVARSSDGGLTYPADDIRLVADGSGYLAYAWVPAPPYGAGWGAAWNAHDKQWLAVSPEGHVLAAWSELLWMNPAKGTAVDYRFDLLVALSTDGGRTWDEPRVAAPGGLYGFASPVALPGGGWAVAYHDYGSQELFVSVASDAAATRWREVRVGDQAYGPFLRVQPSEEGPRLLLAYSRVLDREERLEEPALRWSEDLGATWSEPLALDANEGAGRTRVALDAGPDGDAWVLFLHPRGEDDDARGEVRMVRLEGTAASPPAVLDGFEGPTWVAGDYIGLAAFPGGAHASWTTHRGEAYDLLTARILP